MATEAPAGQKRTLSTGPIARTSDIPRGSMIGAVFEGQRILLANVDGEFLAMRSVCNHLGGPLEKGTLEGNVVTCPLHGSKWDVRTGALVKFTRPLPPEPVFRVSVRGEDIFVEK